ncbi:hypothetical protein PPO43_07640 [Saprospira sp. CCB-QB6]|uniref:DUF6702 family protein n=1 Tax=Saprospira sp. CCB-QB6 TaxID=3023936 RepID=UPI00234BFC4F|nr:DUF6702 family protein [Saprospira sp. CCB-QB6]WCL82956.1 hypothetical protein PPO43_07640 [Saprospira sp. CCB-QB6]
MPSFLTISLVCSILWPFSLSMPAEMPENEEHPIYLSFAEIDYKEKQQALQISIKLFVDDFEQLFSKRLGETVEIGTDREHPQANQLLADYIEQHFQLKADGQTIKYKYLGKEMGEKQNIYECYVFLEAKNLSPFAHLTINNSLLIDEHFNQLNFAACHTKNRGLQKVISRKGEEVQKVKW